MRKPNQGRTSSGKGYSNKSNVTGPIVEPKTRTALNKVNEHPSDGAYVGFGNTMPTIKK